MLDLIQLTPRDEHNRQLEAHVHPPDWVNPTPAGRYNLVVIGGGTAGLVTAAGADMLTSELKLPTAGSGQRLAPSGEDSRE